MTALPYAAATTLIWNSTSLRAFALCDIITADRNRDALSATLISNVVVSIASARPARCFNELVERIIFFDIPRRLGPHCLSKSWQPSARLKGDHRVRIEVQRPTSPVYRANSRARVRPSRDDDCDQRFRDIRASGVEAVESQAYMRAP